MDTQIIERPGIELGNRLKKEKISYHRFAKLINTTPCCISQIISGKRGISMAVAQKIANYFHEDFGYWIKKQAEYSIYKQKNNIPI